MFIITVDVQSILMKKENAMKKVFFATICVVTSFLCSMEQESTFFTKKQPVDVRLSPRSEKINDPIRRVKRQSLGSDQFIKEENAGKFFRPQQNNQDVKK